MRDFFRKIPSLSSKKSGQRRSHKSTGQSLVELAIALPIIILLFTGLVEFGFVLNYYLSLLDATREAARYYSNFDPVNASGADEMQFYQGAANMLVTNLQPRDLAAPQVTDTTRRIILDPNADDVVVVGFSVAGPSITRYPVAGDFHLYNHHPSRIDNTQVGAQLVTGAPNTAILLVEVFYNYHQILGLPWLTVFVPDPILLHAYTMMPMPQNAFAGQPADSELAWPQDLFMPLALSNPVPPQEK